VIRALQATAVVAVVGLFALLVWRLTHQSHPPKVGAPAPNFTLKRLDGDGTLSLRSLRGRPAVINFFASWCEPCKQESKVLESAWRQYRSKGVVFVGIDYNDVTSDGRTFVRAHGITFPTVQGGDASIGNAWGLTGVPETYFVDAQGRLVGSHIEGTVAESHNKALFYASIKAALKP
jgi:cytochrome c biogenesis protein CcmG/thiol:disulfide interchange protein DsbE